MVEDDNNNSNNNSTMTINKKNYRFGMRGRVYVSKAGQINE